MKKAVIRFFIYIFGSALMIFAAVTTPLIWDVIFFDGKFTDKYRDLHVELVIWVFVLSFPIIYFIFATIDAIKKRRGR